MKKCRECQNDVSEQAMACPKCGCPYPAKAAWDGWGYEYKSKTVCCGLPLVHVAFKYRPDRTPVVAKGIIAIGQFAKGIFVIGQFGMGVVTIAQFGIGVICVAQFALAAFALAQFAAAYSLIAQSGLYLGSGKGMLVLNLTDWVQRLFLK